MNWKAFFKTLGVAAGGGALTAVMGAISSGEFKPKQLGAAASAGAAATALAYLKQSPIFKDLPAPQDPPKQ